MIVDPILGRWRWANYVGSPAPHAASVVLVLRGLVVLMERDKLRRVGSVGKKTAG